MLKGKNSYRGGTLIKVGTVSVHEDDNLGASTGGLILNGGKLRNTQSFTTGHRRGRRHFRDRRSRPVGRPHGDRIDFRHGWAAKDRARQADPVQ
ncbi:hypothetical protein GCM10011491_14240 [Brucella endophytica]|uniref:Uncharacterized protein n=1 Tax=Brucella endophytica TaxID=1963359 RepID=A0A916WDA6_9HYPH|nr:hypothetical protein GCM10011491_14240 [Brucella endophytica]